MAVPVALPERFLNLRRLAIADAVLAVLCILFQSVSLGVVYFDRIATGIWGGIIFLATAATVFPRANSSHPEEQGVNGPRLSWAHFFCGQSVLCGCLLAGFNANNINYLISEWHWINCYQCPTVVVMCVLMMLCGFAAVCTNVLIGNALIKQLNFNNNAGDVMEDINSKEEVVNIKIPVPSDGMPSHQHSTSSLV